MKKTLSLWIGIFFLMAAGAAVLRAQSENVPAPDFVLKDLQGKDLKLADYKGKVLVLNFWATWCPPCRAEIPDFVEAYAANKDKGLEILGVSVDRMTADRLLPFVSKAKINYPVVLADAKIVQDYEPGDYIPTTIIIDKKGIVRRRHIGQMDKETLVQLFNQYNNEK
ncbi:TlpA family protein disulfide reductase [bacterium]|nr:MAG: TlpA family protein disulfide reductase [bacterium]